MSFGAGINNNKGILRLHSDNEFQTPYEVCRYMVSLIPVTAKTILEPTPGIGNMIAAIEGRFEDINITAPDDFFLLDRNKKYDVVIGNPPFTSKSADLTNAPPPTP
jgi:type I restriction-modification system DNA methylase subunit